MRTGLAVVICFVFLFAGCTACENYNRAYTRGSNIRTMMALRDVAIALERYQLANGEYPAASDASALRAVLVPTYVETWPGTDKWGEPILVRCNESGYLLTSKGSDKQGDHGFGGAVETTGHSITIQDGVFVQYAAPVESTAREFEKEIAAIRALDESEDEQEEPRQGA